MWFLQPKLQTQSSPDAPFKNWSWQSSNFQMWGLWQIFHIRADTKSPFCCCPPWPEKIQMWCLWQTLQSDIQQKTSCSNCTWKYMSFFVFHESFEQKSLIEHHLATVHGSQSSFPCDVCDTTFTQEISTKQHFADVHGDQKNLKCNFCGKAFVSKRSLKYHLKYLYNEQKKTDSNAVTGITGKLKHV